MQLYFFELSKTVMEKSLAGQFFEITDVVFFRWREGGQKSLRGNSCATTDFVFSWERERREEGRKREGRNRHTRDKIPCSSLADAVN